MTLDEMISHALEQCSIYGEYEFEHLRVVVYPSGMQAWYVRGDPFEWVPVSADFVMDQLHGVINGGTKEAEASPERGQDTPATVGCWSPWFPPDFPF